jgi:hypothetical protein
MKSPVRITSGRVALAIAALAGTGAASLAGASTASADPAWGSASAPLVAVGSNTIEDLFDAFSGTVPTPGDAPATQSYHNFSPLSDPKTGEQVYSWDAVNQASGAAIGDCISTKPGFAPIARPNGSGDGRKALSDAISGTVAWSKTTSQGCNSLVPTGMIDVARSSSGPGSTASCTSATAACLAWVAFAHDAVSYAYVTSGSAVANANADHLSNAQLTALYTNTTTGTYTDPSTGVTYLACLPQLGSGTESFFVGKLNGGTGVSTTTAEAAATAAHCINFEENGANTFYTFANTAIAADASDSPAPTVAVTPFSVGSWISQSNGYAFDRSTTGISSGVQLGYIDAAASGSLPYNGTAGSETPNSSFYTSTYGRDLYALVSNALLNGRASAVNSEFRDIFGYLGTNNATFGTNLTGANTGSGSICGTYAQTTELPDFGFTAPAVACGAESITTITTGTGA